MIKATKTKEGDVKPSTFQFDQDIARRELANMVILHEYPLSIADHSGFQRFLLSVQPMFKIPTRNTLKSDIMKMFAHVQCPHTSLVLADAMMDCILDWHLEKKGSVSYWTGSPKREEKFLETVRELEIVSTKKLAIDCKMRWNSTFLMIRSAVIYKTVFPRLRQRDSQFKCVPTENDWVFAKEISDRLEVFFVATKQFSGTKYPTANNYLPILCDIRYAISQWGTSTVEEIRLMALAMARKFDSY
ncbi:hypothetical protein Ddye_008169 [Dipteronia dyeriana]|uniref:hAT-like transposase RNase-H fold domain-containing protein n=1 Tax=Dipteronia dyeriana TaxID=168575 RepID=A0AAD9X9B4_9ROSI|nr:hypothetical protein Ddye_008169 [Dipteronia dyeriana]